MAQTSVKYDNNPTALTITLASLANSSTLISGQSSAEVSNSSDKHVDVMIQGKITVGSSVTNNTQIQIYVYGSDAALSSKNLDVIDGTNASDTFATVGVRDSVLKLGKVISVDSTATNRTYYVSSFSVAELFGGNMPKHWGVWVTHNTGSALNSTAGNQELTFMGIKYEIG